MSQGSTIPRVTLVDKDGNDIASELINGEHRVIVSTPEVERLLKQLLKVQTEMLHQLKGG